MNEPTTLENLFHEPEPVINNRQPRAYWPNLGDRLDNRARNFLRKRNGLGNVVVTEPTYRRLLQNYHTEYQAHQAQKREILNEKKRELYRQRNHYSRVVEDLRNANLALLEAQEKHRKERKLQELREKRALRRVVKTLRRAPQMLTRTFQIYIMLMIYYKHRDKEGHITYSAPYEKQVIDGPHSRNIREIPELVENYNMEDSVKIQTVASHRVEYQDENLHHGGGVTTTKQLMRLGGFVLQNNWLAYATSISPTAYEETNNRCVYYQLTEYLLHPPTGRPTKFIRNIKTSQDAIFDFFSDMFRNDQLEYWSETYPEFSIDVGVSTEMVDRLCREIKRSLYGFDADNKLFHSYVCTNQNYHYCPIVFYKVHGHMYILNDAVAIRSVAERFGKQTAGKKLITSSVENDENKPETLPVVHLQEFPLETIFDLPAGIYLVPLSNLSDVFADFVVRYTEVPSTKTEKNMITEIRVHNHENRTLLPNNKRLRENVIIACYKEEGNKVTHEQLQNVAEHNGIDYTNEAIGSFIMKIVNNNRVDKRKYLTTEQKEEMVTAYNNQCAMCKSVCDKFQVDHITPLAIGGSNEMSNLQPLCIDCHRVKTKEENEMGIYQVADEAASAFNSQMLKYVFNTYHFRFHQFVQRLVEPEEEQELYSKLTTFKIDHKKCRRNIIYYSQYEWPVYSVMDTFELYTGGEIKCGYYYVKTNASFPFRGCGFYIYALVIEAMKAGVITKEDVIYEFLPSKKLSNDYFQKDIDALLKAFECEPGLQKTAPNAYVGLMGRTASETSQSKFTLDPVEASQWLCGEENDNKKVFIHNMPLSNETILYQGIFTQEIQSESTRYPIYMMILQMEALELWKMEEMIKEHSGIPLDRNTDAIRYACKEEIDFSGFYWDENKNVPKYQREEPIPLKISQRLTCSKPHNEELDKFQMEWYTEYDYAGTVEEKAAEIVASEKSIHIDGRAGTGKTFLANAVLAELKSQGKKVQSFSPTNKGARLIGGETLHSIYYKYRHSKKALLKVLNDTEYIVVDEVSMMLERFYQLFVMIKRVFPRIKFIIVGDFDQLPPVNDTWLGTDYKNSAGLWCLCDGNRLQLMKCRRADRRLFDLCKNVSRVKVMEFQVSSKTLKNIAYTHKTRIIVNKQCMDRVLGARKDYVSLDRDAKNPKTQDLKLVTNMPIIAHTTNKKLNILNSEQFVIKRITTEKMVVCEGERVIEIDTNDFHKYFYLGYCITVHASQGDTITGKYTIYDWKMPFFSEKAKYVALSRATDVLNIQIC